ncbi:phage tail protein [Algoriphagus sp. NF]|mgnify:CR=1 FL=1|jgi:phage tail-like protein|uniref:Phage tail protein n=2 Tax=Algoriphagus TaxID=246875 RepID=A0ABS7N5A3_9BACT|nr:MULTISPECIES: phage tail protein [Algoriphagus]MBY5951519.1 phage tail protein [Algoriphagus marincola]MCR9083228.1 phage tail protein [Cyclobacteriaceae bacterium]MDE0559220.1 phage tail protein [Algoriphagus sp. NF]
MALFYPPTGFHFLVRFEGLLLKYPGIPDVGFQEVGGLSVEIGVEEYAEGGENRFKHRMPNPVSYPNLTMKRGMLVGSQLMKWFKDSVEAFQFEAQDITVILLNEQHLPLQAWNFINAWPVKWNIEGLNAMENTLMIESIEFAYQYYRRIDPTDLLPI